jgi:ribokinase
VVVLGSINMDLVAGCRELPRPGETLTATSFAEVPGGKGANQAVAASRAGGLVSLIGRVGDDGFATRLVGHLSEAGVDCSAVQATGESPSGLAMIAVAESGENQIVVVPGANACLRPEDVDRYASIIRSCDVLLLQLEVPVASVMRSIELAREAGVRVILDPAPAPTALPAGMYDVDLICPNETEAATLTGQAIDSTQGLQAAAQTLHARGAQAVAITLGGRGTLLFDGKAFLQVAPYPTTAVDSTAAGDAFAGAVAVRWAESKSLADAVRWGNAAGALAASRHGAQPSMATREEIEQLVMAVAS